MSAEVQLNAICGIVLVVALAVVGLSVKSCTEAERAAYVACVQQTGKPLECDTSRGYRR